MATTFESGFAETEKAAATASKTAAALKAAAGALQKAASVGDIGKMRRAVDRLREAANAVDQAAANAREAWPFSPADEEEYLRGGFRREITEAAKTVGISMFSRDDDLVAFPCILRIDAVGRSIRIDRARHPELRPQHLLGILRAARTSRQRLDSQQFLDVLFLAYRELTAHEDFGTTVPLARIYKTITLLPWVARDYSRQEFARDLLVLNASGVHATRQGCGVMFPGSTAIRISPGDTFATVDEQGETITFYGIRFTKPEA